MANIISFKQLKTASLKNVFLQKMASALVNGNVDLNLRFSTIEHKDGKVKTASVNEVVNSRQFLGKFPNIASALVKVADARYSFTAGVDDFLARIIPALTVGAAIGGSKILYDKYQTNSAFSDMFNEYPDLKEADQDRVRRLFHILKTYSPNVAKDSVSSGAVIKQMLDYPDAIGPQMINNLVQIEANSGGKATPRVYDEAMSTLVRNGVTNAIAPPGDEKDLAMMRFRNDHRAELEEAGMMAPPKSTPPRP